MKRLLFLMSIITSLIFADEIDELIKKIKQERVSKINKEKLKTLKSPLPKIVIEKNSSKKDGNITIAQNVAPVFILKGIMNGRAYINDHWVKKGDSIGNYKVVDILEDAVYLSNGKKSKMIFFKKKNGKIILRKASK